MFSNENVIVKVDPDVLKGDSATADGNDIVMKVEQKFDDADAIVPDNDTIIPDNDTIIADNSGLYILILYFISLRFKKSNKNINSNWLIPK